MDEVLIENLRQLETLKADVSGEIAANHLDFAARDDWYEIQVFYCDEEGCYYGYVMKFENGEKYEFFSNEAMNLFPNTIRYMLGVISLTDNSDNEYVKWLLDNAVKE